MWYLMGRAASFSSTKPSNSSLCEVDIAEQFERVLVLWSSLSNAIYQLCCCSKARRFGGKPVSHAHLHSRDSQKRAFSVSRRFIAAEFKLLGPRAVPWMYVRLPPWLTQTVKTQLTV